MSVVTTVFKPHSLFFIISSGYLWFWPSTFLPFLPLIIYMWKYTGPTMSVTVFQNFNLNRATFKFLRSRHTYGFNWNLNPLKVLDVAKYSVFIAFFKLKHEIKTLLLRTNSFTCIRSFIIISFYIHIYFSYIFSYFDFSHVLSSF
jgi:hypothetical protein